MPDTASPSERYDHEVGRHTLYAHEIPNAIGPRPGKPGEGSASGTPTTTNLDFIG